MMNSYILPFFMATLITLKIAKDLHEGNSAFSRKTFKILFGFSLLTISETIPNKTKLISRTENDNGL